MSVFWWEARPAAASAGECLLDALGGEVAVAEIADLGAGEPVG